MAGADVGGGAAMVMELRTDFENRQKAKSAKVAKHAEGLLTAVPSRLRGASNACAFLGVLAIIGMAAMPAAESEAAMNPSGVRLKDLVEIQGVRENQLHGIGVVVGISGTGDKTPATVRMLKQLLATKNLSFTDADLASKNVAMVAVTADLPPFKRSGDRLVTQVSCLGDASSLRGGVLLQTPLAGADGKFYAVGQGTVSIGGFGSAQASLGPSGSNHTNQETVGLLSQGAIVERDVPMSLLFGDRLALKLRNSDFTTASRVARVLSETFGTDRVIATDAELISLTFPTKPGETELVDCIAKVLALRVEPDSKARVVINARTGTVVAGRDVRISPVAVSHGGLSLRILPKRVTAPGATAGNTEWIDPATNQRMAEPPKGTRPTAIPGTVSLLEGASVEDIANGLNALGARPRDVIAIFQAIQGAGALHAELIEL